MLVAPREIGGALARLMLKPGFQGIVSGSPTVQPLDAYQGATVTVSVDSATLADGHFIGADTQNFFERLVAEDAAKRKFFSDVVGFQHAGFSRDHISEELARRKAAADADKGKMPQYAFAALWVGNGERKPFTRILEARFAPPETQPKSLSPTGSGTPPSGAPRLKT